MKILFNRNNSIGIFCLLLLLAVGAVSCIKDEYAENKEKATVQVTFTTRAVSDETVAGSDLADNERMKTLRVIVAKDGKILYNEYYEEADQKVNNTMDEWLLGQITSDEYADKVQQILLDYKAQAEE